MAPRILDRNVAQVHRLPRQAKAGVPPGKGGAPGIMGQPPFEPTPEQRSKVTLMVACGFTNESISVVTGIPQATLERHFKEELQHGKIKTDANILTGIARQALEGDKTMAIFWAKSRAGWRDVGKDGDNSASAVFSINIGHGNGGVTIDHEPTSQTPTGGDVTGRISVTHRMRDPDSGSEEER